MSKPELDQKDLLNPEEVILNFELSRRKFYRFLKEESENNFVVLYGSRKLIIREEFKNYLEKYPQVKEELLNGRKTKDKT